MTRNSNAAKAGETIEEKVKGAAEEVSEKATAAVETVEVKLNEVVANTSASSAWLVESMRRLMLASIGAIAMTIDEAEGLVGKLVERGELAQKDGQKFLQSIRSRLPLRAPQAEKAGEQIGGRIEQGVEELLTRLNIPSKRDIEDLSARIAQLTARVEELKKSK